MDQYLPYEKTWFHVCVDNTVMLSQVDINEKTSTGDMIDIIDICEDRLKSSGMASIWIQIA